MRFLLLGFAEMSPLDRVLVSVETPHVLRDDVFADQVQIGKGE